MRDEKARLRREVAERLAKLGAGEIQRLGESALARLALTDEFRRAGSFLLYASMADEIDTAPLIDRLLAAGKTVFLPVCRPDARDLQAVAIADREKDLVPRHYGILAPRAGLAAGSAAEVEFALVPGRAFDRRGNRLGRGGGFYDRFLARLDARAVRAAVALDCQVFPRVPAGERDQPVGLIITEREVIRP